ncbi:hypothetical protein HJ526_07230 [Donghicola sp. C2-DW-16]|uniref:Uncharacterized protein n=1 Tax=Donghicola mangrovi TaxID=2729614 RepID=A0ABX2PCK8_9RHOB|nr:hypothetical protein [Donghicola mangrovi]NVO27204.1 hypothetical protein [Donghicola mangrovi]
MLLAAKILLTISSLGYSLIPFLFDSNKTHWFNPSWTPHARFHCVWQVMSYVYIAILALVLIWTAGDTAWPIWIAAILSVCAYGGFWTAVAMRPIYGGHLVDEVNGVPPFKLPILGLCDANVTLFTTAVIILMTGCALLGSAAFVVEEITQAAVILPTATAAL